MKFIDLDTFIFALAFTLQNLKVGCNGFGFKKKKNHLWNWIPDHALSCPVIDE